MIGLCTILFDPPFWIAIFETTDEDGYRAARYVFGGEPNEAELHAFALTCFKDIHFSAPVAPADKPLVEKNFKRRQRETRRLMEGQPPLKQAWAAMQASLESHRLEKRVLTRLEKEAAGSEKFRARQRKKKEKLRGH